MASRMERYYSANSQVKTRSRTNEDLYKKIYDGGEYSNVEGIATIEKGKEIDIEKIKKLLEKREEEKRIQAKRNYIEKEEPIPVKIEEIDDSRNYDIRDVLNKAKDGRVKDDKERSLKNTQYDILKGLNLKKVPDRIDEDSNLEDLINTITHNSALNQLADGDLSLDLLDDLKSNGNTDVVNTGSIHALLNEEKVAYEKKKKEEQENNEIDKSFYTSSFNFKADDFETMIDLNNNLKKRNKLIKILVFIAVLIAIIVGLFLYFYLKK